MVESDNANRNCLRGSILSSIIARLVTGRPRLRCMIVIPTAHFVASLVRGYDEILVRFKVGVIELDILVGL